MKTLYILLLFPVLAMAQQDRVWYFGAKAGLDFTTGSPVALINSQMIAGEGCASISDSDGHLLFYTNGMQVWNKNHAIMENGNGLLGHQSSTQSAIIVPNPDVANIWYIFTTTAIAQADGLRYSVVDIDANGGLGAVTQKNILLDTPTCEKLTATWHANGEAIWVVSHRFGGDTFCAHLVTAAGVSGVPVLSNGGSIIDFPNNGAAGCMKISPDGSKLAIASDYDETQLFDFDNATGMVSNPVTLSFGGYGVEFSPSGKLLYTNDNFTISQYNLEAPDIPASVVEVQAAPPGMTYGTMQNGPEGKMYIAHYSEQTLSVINNPDVSGAGCNFSANSVDLAFRFSQLGLPNFLPPTFRVGFQVQKACVGSAVIFTANSLNGVPETIQWDFGDGSSSTDTTAFHTYAEAGTYTVKLTGQRQGITRIAERQVIIVALPQAHTPDDMRLCDAMGNGTAIFSLSANESQILAGQPNTGLVVTYHLSEAAAEAGSDALDNTFTNTTNPQMIYARVTNTVTGCHAVTFFSLIVEELVIDLPHSFPVCEGSTIQLTAPEGFDSYEWSTGVATRSIEVAQAGTYTLTVFRDSNGMMCSASKDINVLLTDMPVITSVDVNDWSIDHNSITVNTNDGDYQYSIDGLHFQQSNTFENLIPGLYTVYVQNACGTISKEVVLMMYPKFFTPNGDGDNENWAIEYSWFEPGMSVHIFDRYGKLLTSFKGNDPGWDGRYNGHDLPSTDYWFVVERKDGRQYKGHFSMLR